MKIIFLDFDGVMDTAYYDHILSKKGLPEVDKYGAVFDPDSSTTSKLLLTIQGPILLCHHRGRTL